MPFQLLDLILIGIMLVSGLLALMRGFTREVLTLIAWGGAAIAAYFAIQQQPLLDLVQPYIDKPMIAQGRRRRCGVHHRAHRHLARSASRFRTRLSTAPLVPSTARWASSTAWRAASSSSSSPICSMAGCSTEDKQEDWVRNAMSLPAIKYAGGVLLDFMPADIADTLKNTALIGNPEKAPVAAADPAREPGYQSNDTQGLDNLIEGTGNGTAEQGTGTQPAADLRSGQPDNDRRSRPRSRPAA